MSADQNLNPQQFYHASPHNFSPGDVIEPGHSPVASSGKQSHVFVTTSLPNAKSWAKHGMEGGAVYQTSAPGKYEPDPLPTGKDEYRTRENLTVQKRVYKARS